METIGKRLKDLAAALGLLDTSALRSCSDTEIDLIREFRAAICRERERGGRLLVASAAVTSELETSLREMGVDINKDAWMAVLNFSIRQGAEEIIKVLLRAGADPDIVGTHIGQSPIEIARQVGRQEIIKLLESHRVTPLSVQRNDLVPRRFMRGCEAGARPVSDAGLPAPVSGGRWQAVGRNSVQGGQRQEDRSGEGRYCCVQGGGLAGLKKRKSHKRKSKKRRKYSKRISKKRKSIKRKSKRRKMRKR